MSRDSAGGESWSIADFIANLVALIISWLSMVSFGVMPMPIEMAVSWIWWDRMRRRAALNCLLSFTWFSQGASLW